MQAPSPALTLMMLTGQSSRYHNWPVTSAHLARRLGETGLFDVTTIASPAAGQDMTAFRPRFDDYTVVVMDYEGDDWPDATKQALVEYVRTGGGLVIYHASDNAFPHWPEFQELCGVGGWAGRDESWGPKVRWRDGRLALDPSPGTAMHPPQHDFIVTTRAPDHPIMRGLPAEWLQPHDELYSQLRGPAKHLEVLATGWADPARFEKATGEHEPVLMTIRYGRGRVFHTTLGHVGPTDTADAPSVTSAGFVTTLRRGAEWAATGDVVRR